MDDLKLRSKIDLVFLKCTDLGSWLCLMIMSRHYEWFTILMKKSSHQLFIVYYSEYVIDIKHTDRLMFYYFHMQLNCLDWSRSWSLLCLGRCSGLINKPGHL